MAVRILEALLLLPDLMVELALDVVADRVELRQLLRALALADVALAEVLERAVFKRAVLPRLLRVDVAQRLRAVKLLAALGKQGLVEVGKGRQGTRLTAEGLLKLEEQDFA